MALTKIKTGGITNNAVTDAKVADAITVTGAQTGITQVGTLTAGTWQGTKVASAYLDDDTAHLSGSAFTGTISSSTSSTTDSALTLTDAGVADYKFTFPDTSTIRLSTSTSSTKVFDLSNAGSGKMKLSVDGGLRPITGSDYSLVLESTNELNFYNADGYADSNRATLHINYSGTGSTVDLSNSELVVVKGTGSTFAGNVVMSEDKRISIGTWDNSGFTGSNAYGLSIDSELPIVHMSDTDTNKKAFFGLSGDNMYIGGNPVDDMVFQTGSGVEKMRIQSGGNVGINDSSPGMKLTVVSNHSSGYVASFHNDGGVADRYGIRVSAGTDNGSGNNYHVSCMDGDNDLEGALRVDSGTFSLYDNSDRRLKDNIRDTEINGTDIVHSIKVRDFEWKKSGATHIAGFVAQELKESFEPASPDSEDDLYEGKPKMMAISRERLVPVLIKAVQELSAKVEALEGN